ncbi:MAG: NAD(P)/FAD-dependent oxidoreductase [Candidatus Aenigmarchaeota archaeon]|nr:NAD(P)/FAD-dependent oxidoreductase [Candidatus Aenigmarchaeota archaeon]
MKFDVVIVGSGPAGLFAARELETKFKVALIEKEGAVGHYGNRVINKDVFKALRVSEDTILNYINEISFISPSGLTITTKKEGRGYVISKEKMQQDMFSQLQNTTTFMNSCVKEIDLLRNRVVTNDNVFEFDFLLAADGAHSSIRSQFSQENPIIIKCFYGIFKKSKEPTSCVLSNKFARGFYGWSIDLGDTVEIGLGGFQEPVHHFKDFLKNFFPSTTALINEKRGFIPRSVVKRRVYENCILIGDSTGGEPLMGSSIHKAIDEAKMASKLILENKHPKFYESLWEERFSKEFKFEESVRNKLDHMGDDDIDSFFLKKKEIKSEGLVTGLFKNLVTQ